MLLKNQINLQITHVFFYLYLFIYLIIYLFIFDRFSKLKKSVVFFLHCENIYIYKK